MQSMAQNDFLHEIRFYNPQRRLNQSIFDPPPPRVPKASADDAAHTRARSHSFINRPRPAYIRDAKKHASTDSIYRCRPRVFSAPSFRERVGTGELERGGRGYLESVTTSRSVTEESRTSPELWASVFRVLNDIPDSLMRDEAFKRTSLNNRDACTDPGKMIRPTSIRRISSHTSMASALSMVSQQYDPDDPRLTGKLKEKLSIDLPNPEEAERFILLLTRALMKYGAPSHRVESQLMAVAALLRVKMQVIHVPKCTIISFGNHIGSANNKDTRFVKAATQIELGRLHQVHDIYKKVVHCQESAKHGSSELKALLKKAPIYNVPTQIVLAITCGMVISPLAFKGSVLDLMSAGILCGIVSFLHVWAAKKNKMFSNFVEISSATLVAFVARGLSSIPSGIFCYSAITSASIVKLLPKYLIICGSLELASKHIISGSVKMVYAVIWSLFLGFALAMGSDMYYLIDNGARLRRLAATQYLSTALNLQGTFMMDGSSVVRNFAFTNVTEPPSSRLYSVNGCYRAPDWPWYLQRPPMWTLFFLVPLYAFFSALASFQPVRSRELFVMIVISCCSYAANRAVHIYIPSRGDVSSAIGAFVIGAMGHLYSRIFHGTAFIAMFNGIGFLVPTAIAATGGLAQNYRGKDGDHYTSSLELALRMIQVALGTTIGLFSSALVVYSFGTKKKGALWAF